MIYSYVSKTVEEGGWAGVCRFDYMLRQQIPGLQSVSRLPELKSNDIVITDNHLATEIPEEIHTIVMHHGCAATHFQRIKSWQNKQSQAMVTKQHSMFCARNRIYVAPSAWVADEFRRNYLLGDRYRPIIAPYWVELIESLPKWKPPVVIGDWRDENKGSTLWRSIAALCPECEFKQLQYDPSDQAARRKIYGAAALFLMLSASEGGAYSMADAEAASLPIVTTNVGNYREFEDCKVVNWEDRENPQSIAMAIMGKMTSGRRRDSFYKTATLAKARLKWAEIVDAATKPREAVK